MPPENWPYRGASPAACGGSKRAGLSGRGGGKAACIGRNSRSCRGRRRCGGRRQRRLCAVGRQVDGAKAATAPGRRIRLGRRKGPDLIDSRSRHAHQVALLPRNRRPLRTRGIFDAALLHSVGQDDLVVGDLLDRPFVTVERTAQRRERHDHLDLAVTARLEFRGFDRLEHGPCLNADQGSFRPQPDPAAKSRQAARAEDSRGDRRAGGNMVCGQYHEVPAGSKVSSAPRKNSQDGQDSTNVLCRAALPISGRASGDNSKAGAESPSLLRSLPLPAELSDAPFMACDQSLTAADFAHDCPLQSTEFVSGKFGKRLRMFMFSRRGFAKRWCRMNNHAARRFGVSSCFSALSGLPAAIGPVDRRTGASALESLARDHQTYPAAASETRNPPPAKIAIQTASARPSIEAAPIGVAARGQVRQRRGWNRSCRRAASDFSGRSESVALGIERLRQKSAEPFADSLAA